MYIDIKDYLSGDRLSHSLAVADKVDRELTELSDRLSPEKQLELENRFEELILEAFGENFESEMEQKIELLMAGSLEDADLEGLTEEEIMQLFHENTIVVLEEIALVAEELLVKSKELILILKAEFEPFILEDHELIEQPIGWEVVVPQEKDYDLLLTIGIDQAIVFGDIVSMDQPPMIIDGRTMVPLRFLGEALGAEIVWDQSSRSVHYVTETDDVYLQIGNDTAFVSGREYKIDTAPQILNGRTMVPLRFVSEHLGYEVEWVNDTKSILISK